MIEQVLYQLGFSEKEALVYLAVLKHGQVLPSELARLTGLQRPTVYSVARELELKGALREIRRKGSIYFTSTNPHELTQLVTKEEARLEKKRRTVSEAIQLLQGYQRESALPVPGIQLVTEEDLERFFYARIPLWDASALSFDATWWGFQDHTLVDQFEAVIDWFWTQTSPKIRVKLFSNQAPIETKMKAKGYGRREIRFWKEATFTGTTWVIGAYVVMVVTDRKPMYLVELHDETMARNQALVFERLWLQGSR